MSVKESEPRNEAPSTKAEGVPSERLPRDALGSERRARTSAAAFSVDYEETQAPDRMPSDLGRTTLDVEAPTRVPPNASTTQESVAIDPRDLDRSLLAERRISVLEDEVNQLNARVRLAEKSVEETRRLAMAAALFTLVALIVLKWFFR